MVHLAHDRRRARRADLRGRQRRRAPGGGRRPPPAAACAAPRLLLRPGRRPLRHGPAHHQPLLPLQVRGRGRALPLRAWRRRLPPVVRAGAGRRASSPALLAGHGAGRRRDARRRRLPDAADRRRGCRRRHPDGGRARGLRRGPAGTASSTWWDPKPSATGVLLDRVAACGPSRWPGSRFRRSLGSGRGGRPPRPRRVAAKGCSPTSWTACSATRSRIRLRCWRCWAGPSRPLDAALRRRSRARAGFESRPASDVGCLRCGSASPTTSTAPTSLPGPPQVRPASRPHLQGGDRDRRPDQRRHGRGLRRPQGPGPGGVRPRTTIATGTTSWSSLRSRTSASCFTASFASGSITQSRSLRLSS